jgi:predicted nicotinamide N-methyase
MPLEPLADPSLRLARPWLCPEFELAQTTDFQATWEFGERLRGGRGLAPPYWANSWPGGQALARHILDAPGLVAGRRVLDLGAGSGLCAIAAAARGAAHVLAADIDPQACRAAAANALHNGVSVETLCADLLGDSVARWDLVLAADLWYERFLARRVNAWLLQQSQSGVEVLVGDVGRAYLPRRGLVEVARSVMPACDGFEREAQTVGVVYRLGSTRENTVGGRP